MSGKPFDSRTGGAAAALPVCPLLLCLPCRCPPLCPLLCCVRVPVLPPL